MSDVATQLTNKRFRQLERPRAEFLVSFFKKGKTKEKWFRERTILWIPRH